jgi:hypothetical protein
MFADAIGIGNKRAAAGLLRYIGFAADSSRGGTPALGRFEKSILHLTRGTLPGRVG